MANAATPKPAIPQAAPEAVSPGFAMPSAEQLAVARAQRKQAGTASELAPGTVVGLPEGWVAAKMDPALDAGRQATLTAKWLSKGWIKLEGLHQVVGYPLGAIVFVKAKADYEADRQERDEHLKAMAASGLLMLGQA